MSNEKNLVIALSVVVLLIISLVAALTLTLGWSLLGIATLLFALAYPLIWVAWRCYSFWCQAIRQLTTFTQILKEGEQNLRFKQQNPDNLLLALQKEITGLAQVNLTKSRNHQSLDNLLNHILDAWSVPVCLFDENLQLTYRNTAMNEQIQQPMLVGSFASNLGFKHQNGQLTHPKFDQQWQCQSIQYKQENQDHWLFSAINISQLLNKNSSVTQQNLIRVLGHELRNSLTPMASMTDTLLSADELDEQQTRLVLSRIHKRSNRLLSFISEYSKLTQLPLPRLEWFDLSEIIDETKLLVNEQLCLIEFQGNQQCFGDEEQIAQVIINLVKNAQEASKNIQTKIVIKAFYKQEQQIIEVEDNGPGFANLNNVLTPFYTTKPGGSGIGLSLCAEIIKNHFGQLSVENRKNKSAIVGASILMSWPIVS
ncbi:MAG: two-component system nitrogen regulation sensor histidine kinase NtrY [Colwellia sp.]